MRYLHDPNPLREPEGSPRRRRQRGTREAAVLALILAAGCRRRGEEPGPRPGAGRARGRRGVPLGAPRLRHSRRGRVRGDGPRARARRALRGQLRGRRASGPPALSLAGAELAPRGARCGAPSPRRARVGGSASQRHPGGPVRPRSGPATVRVRPAQRRSSAPEAIAFASILLPTGRGRVRPPGPPGPRLYSLAVGPPTTPTWSGWDARTPLPRWGSARARRPGPCSRPGRARSASPFARPAGPSCASPPTCTLGPARAGASATFQVAVSEPGRPEREIWRRTHRLGGRAARRSGPPSPRPGRRGREPRPPRRPGRKPPAGVGPLAGAPRDGRSRPRIPEATGAPAPTDLAAASERGRTDRRPPHRPGRGRGPSLRLLRLRAAHDPGDRPHRGGGCRLRASLQSQRLHSERHGLALELPVPGSAPGGGGRRQGPLHPADHPGRAAARGEGLSGRLHREPRRRRLRPGPRLRRVPRRLPKQGARREG